MGSSDRAALNDLDAMLHGNPGAGSISEYCAQMRRLNSNTGNVNAALGAVCATNQSACSNTCSQLVQKYQRALNSCNGCAAEYVYVNALNQLQGRAQQCNGLRARAESLNRQGLGAGAGDGYASYCQQIASASPQNSGSGAPLMAARTGSTNFNDPTNQRGSSDETARKGNVGFKETERTQSSFKDFNIGDPSDQPRDRGFVAQPGVQPQQVNVAAVPNNSGGAVPGTGGVTPPADLGGPARPSPGSPGFGTDVEQGFRSGSGFTYGGNTSGSGSGFEDYGPRGGARYVASARDERSNLVGTDLRQFLPGGSRDPNRRVGGYGPRSEINSKEDDIWKRISAKIEEKCKLGVLWRCR